VIRNAVIHLNGEQPVIADLFEAPGSGDVNLVCTNLRTLAGKRPVFVDDSGGTFVFPYAHIRFIEIRRGQPVSPEVGAATGVAAAAGVATEPGPAGDDGDLEIDEEFLRRVREA
jgi:hypothetical protein